MVFCKLCVVKNMKNYDFIVLFFTFMVFCNEIGVFCHKNMENYDFIVLFYKFMVFCKLCVINYMKIMILLFYFINSWYFVKISSKI